MQSGKRRHKKSIRWHGLSDKTGSAARPDGSGAAGDVSVSQSDLEALAASRAKTVQAYLLQTGKVAASRLFLKQSESGSLRSDGSRVYLQFR